MSFPKFHPQKIYYEPDVLSYALGGYLYQKYHNKEWIPIENHNNIPFFRNQPNSEFAKMKRNMIVGIRKTHKYTVNHKTSDYLVPYTSSGCSASCLYCYLVCNYNKCSYLRLFVNREKMLGKIIKTSLKSEKPLTFEIGSNSDLILENTITDNLPWTIETFAKEGKGFLTFPTKFDKVDPLIDLDHKGKTVVRMSVNPEKIIKSIEFGTSDLNSRINAINRLSDAGYPIGLLIAPVIMVRNWKEQYIDLLNQLECCLSSRSKESMFIEIIFMTYSYVHKMINREAFPNAVDLFDKELMTGRGRGKYCYKLPFREDGEAFLRSEISKRFPNNKIVYVV